MTHMTDDLKLLDDLASECERCGDNPFSAGRAHGIRETLKDARAVIARLRRGYRCTLAEREVLDGIYKEAEPLRKYGITEFWGEYVRWEQIISACGKDADGGYTESPIEIIHTIINERDLWREEVRAYETWQATLGQEDADAAYRHYVAAREARIKVGLG